LARFVAQLIPVHIAKVIFRSYGQLPKKLILDPLSILQVYCCASHRFINQVCGLLSGEVNKLPHNFLQQHLNKVDPVRQVGFRCEALHGHGCLHTLCNFTAILECCLQWMVYGIISAFSDGANGKIGDPRPFTSFRALTAFPDGAMIWLLA
jgi:hypothetical protein